MSHQAVTVVMHLRCLPLCSKRPNRRTVRVTDKLRLRLWRSRHASAIPLQRSQSTGLLNAFISGSVRGWSESCRNIPISQVTLAAPLNRLLVGWEESSPRPDGIGYFSKASSYSHTFADYANVWAPGLLSGLSSELSIQRYRRDWKSWLALMLLVRANIRSDDQAGRHHRIVRIRRQNSARLPIAGWGGCSHARSGSYCASASSGRRHCPGIRPYHCRAFSDVRKRLYPIRAHRRASALCERRAGQQAQ